MVGHGEWWDRLVGLAAHAPVPDLSVSPVTDWGSYLAEFHGERPGITETLLGRCVGPGGEEPYRWLTRLLGDGGGPDAQVIDLACGNGPAAGHFVRWVGLDLSAAELGAARAAGRGPLIAASATAVPLASDCATTVLAMMSLMVIDDPVAALAEAARLLVHGGRLGILLPAQWPLRASDIARYGLLLGAVGRRATPFPHPEFGERLVESLERAGFTVTHDDRARFTFPMAVPADADLFVDALYLPEVDDRRIGWAKAVARRWGHGDMALALRRVVAVRRPDAEPTAGAAARTR